MFRECSFDTGRIQRAQMRIVDQSRGPVAAAGILAMAAGAGGIEILNRLGGVGRADGGRSGLLRGDLAEKQRSAATGHNECNRYRFHGNPHC